MTTSTRRPLALLAALVLGFVAAPDARAENLVVEVDHALLLHLDKDADIVHIANPEIADVALESPRLIFVVGLSVGQTGVHILDRDGNEMIAGSILVTASESNEITVNRNAAEATYSCTPRCSEVSVEGGTSTGIYDTGGSGEGDSDLGLTE